MSRPAEPGRTIRLLVEYDGTCFAGWQHQRGLSPERTVQGALQRAVEAMTGTPTHVRGASRTDAGVHARGQVATFRTTKDRIPLIGFERGLGQYLPKGVVIRRADLPEPGFDARRSSRGKHYRYSIWNDPRPTALDRDRAWWVRGRPLDLEAMAAAGQVLVGTHDFEAFRSAGCSARHAVRTLYRVEVRGGERSLIQLEVFGNAFVRNMVRIIAGNLCAVGLGKMDVAGLAAVLASRDRSRGDVTAPPHGLCLEEVIYDDRLPPRPKDDVDLEPEIEED